MNYDVFVDEEFLADKIISIIDRTCMIDRTEEPDIYQFFDLNQNQIVAVRSLFDENLQHIEIRESEKGDVIWPRGDGIGLDSALDVI